MAQTGDPSGRGTGGESVFRYSFVVVTQTWNQPKPAKTTQNQVQSPTKQPTMPAKTTQNHPQ